MDLEPIKKKIGEFWIDFLGFLPNFLVSIFIFIIFCVIANIYHDKIINSGNKINGEQYIHINSNNLIYKQLSELVYYIIIIVGLLFTLSYLGFNLTGLIAIVGVIGFSIGFAMQNSLQNIISGIYIALLGMYQIGDYIALQTVSLGLPTYGKVIDFNLYFTTIQQTGQTSFIEIPNSLFQSNLISIIKTS